MSTVAERKRLPSPIPPCNQHPDVGMIVIRTEGRIQTRECPLCGPKSRIKTIKATITRSDDFDELALPE